VLKLKPSFFEYPVVVGLLLFRIRAIGIRNLGHVRLHDWNLDAAAEGKTLSGVLVLAAAMHRIFIVQRFAATVQIDLELRGGKLVAYELRRDENVAITLFCARLGAVGMFARILYSPRMVTAAIDDVRCPVSGLGAVLLRESFQTGYLFLVLKIISADAPNKRERYNDERFET
jgi:hypothetical protein